MAEARFDLGSLVRVGFRGRVGAAKASNGRIVVVGVADPVVKNRNTVAGANSAQAFASGEAMLAARAASRLWMESCLHAPLRTPQDHQCGSDARSCAERKAARTRWPRPRRSLRSRHATARCRSSLLTATALRPAINEMNRMVAQGKIGRLVRFENFFACDLPGHQGKWFSDLRKSGGGAFLDMGSHSVDLFHYMVGPSKVVASAFDYKWKGRAETAGTVMLSGTRKGAKATGGYVPAGVAGMIVSGVGREPAGSRSRWWGMAECSRTTTKSRTNSFSRISLARPSRSRSRATMSDSLGSCRPSLMPLAEPRVTSCGRWQVGRRTGCCDDQ